MFLDFIKSLVLKRTLKKCLGNVIGESLNSSIVRIGLIIDESNFAETSALKEEIISKGFFENNIKIIAFRDSVKSKGVYLEPVFGLQDLNFKSKFTNVVINEFIEEEFDLLINYFAEEKPFLMLLSHRSKAKFKVGFSAVDNRLNHLLINIKQENYKGFTSELFRYLKILNKI
jgi:hypothetical protein